MKIKKLDSILLEEKNIYTDSKENKQNSIHLLTNLCQKFEMRLSDLFYDSTFYKTSYFIFDINENQNIFPIIKEKIKDTNSISTSSSLIYNKILLLYEPIEKTINFYEIKIETINNEKIIDSLLIINKYLYILTNTKMYEYNIV